MGFAMAQGVHKAEPMEVTMMTRTRTPLVALLFSLGGCAAADITDLGLIDVTDGKAELAGITLALHIPPASEEHFKAKVIGAVRIELVPASAGQPDATIRAEWSHGLAVSDASRTPFANVRLLDRSPNDVVITVTNRSASDTLDAELKIGPADELACDSYVGWLAELGAKLDLLHPSPYPGVSFVDADARAANYILEAIDAFVRLKPCDDGRADNYLAWLELLGKWTSRFVTEFLAAEADWILDQLLQIMPCAAETESADQAWRTWTKANPRYGEKAKPHACSSTPNH